MSLIVEDGTGKTDAESYISVADADTYHSNHGNPATWSGASTGTKETALREATDYVDRFYGAVWVGTRKTTTQRLYWPRYDAWVDDVLLDSTILPRPLKEAVAELALRHISEGSAGLMPDISEPGVIASESVSVGPVSESKSYAGGKSQVKDFRKVRLLVGPLIGAGRLMRA